VSNYQDHFKKQRKIEMKKPSKFNNKIKGKAKSNEPKWLALIATVLAAGSIWYLTVGEEQTAKIMSKVEISAFGKAIAGEDPKKADAPSAAKTADAPAKSEEKSTTPTTAVGQGQDPQAKASAKSWTDEEIALFSKLDERKKQLDSREASLNKLEEELQKQRTEIEKKLASLEEVRGKIAGRLEDKVKSDGEKVAALVTIYSNMKPAQAATIIQGMNEELAVEVLTKMKNKNAAEILNMMDVEKAKHLSERFAGFREPASVQQ
jgi:flagellar motility protein MotE (MotC chaperone)